MKITISLLAVIILVNLKGLAGDSPVTTNRPSQFLKPILQPVLILPTNVPAIINWHTTNLPPMTNRPGTKHLSRMTNHPVLRPPSGLTVLR